MIELRCIWEYKSCARMLPGLSGIDVEAAFEMTIEKIVCLT